MYLLFLHILLAEDYWVWVCYHLVNSFQLFGWLCWGLTSQSTIFQSCRDGAIASWVINQYFRGVKCLAQGHNTAAVGLEPRTSRSGVRHSTTEPPRSPHFSYRSLCLLISYFTLLLHFLFCPCIQVPYVQCVVGWWFIQWQWWFLYFEYH